MRLTSSGFRHGTRQRVMKVSVVAFGALLVLSSGAEAQNRASAGLFQTLDSSQFTGKVAVDAESNVALIGLTNGTVTITTRTMIGFWTTGLVLSGSTSGFGAAIEFDGGWALIAEDGTARVVRTYQYLNGAFQQADSIAAPNGIAADSLFGARMAISADGRIAAIASFDHDLIGVPGDDHGVVSLFERSGTSWIPRGDVTAGAFATHNGQFGLAVALAGDGRRLAVGGGNRVHLFDRNPTTHVYTQVKVLEGSAFQQGFGWDVDLAEDGETLIVGVPLSNGGVAIFRRNEGAWDQVQGMNESQAGMGWAVGVSQGIAASGSISYVPSGVTFSAFHAWGNDLEAVANWNVGAPNVTFGAQTNNIQISMDGPWIFVGYQNLTTLPQVRIFNIFSPLPFPRQGDLNGDLHADLLWRHPTGRTAAWLMSGTTLQQSVRILDSESSWQIVATGDFNRDRRIDLLWRDPEGRLMVWLMNGTGLMEARWIYAEPTTWQVVGTGDFNEDGHVDLVWQDLTGRVLVWYLNGTTLVSPKYLSTATTDWEVVGTGDFNGDNHPDLVWQHPSGKAVLWLMNGAELLEAQGLSAGDTEWRIAGAKDFDLDLKPDLLWQHPTGKALVWLMNGNAIAGTRGVLSDTTEWKVIAR
jgi:hypothetical protein